MMELDEAKLYIKIRYRKKGNFWTDCELMYAKMPLEKAKELWKRYCLELAENEVI